MHRFGLVSRLRPARSFVFVRKSKLNLCSCQISKCYTTSGRVPKIDDFEDVILDESYMVNPEDELMDELDEEGFEAEADFDDDMNEDEESLLDSEKIDTDLSEEKLAQMLKKKILLKMIMHRKSYEHQKIIDLYENLPVETTEVSDIYYEVMRAYLSLGREREAMDVFEHAKSFELSSADIYNTYLFYLVSKRDYIRAEVILREMIENDKLSVFSYLLQIEVAYHNRDADSVCKIYERLMLEPKVFNHKFVYRALLSTIQFYSKMKLSRYEQKASRLFKVINHLYGRFADQFITKEFSQIHDKVMLGITVQMKRRLQKDFFIMQRKQNAAAAMNENYTTFKSQSELSNIRTAIDSTFCKSAPEDSEQLDEVLEKRVVQEFIEGEQFDFTGMLEDAEAASFQGIVDEAAVDDEPLEVDEEEEAMADSIECYDDYDDDDAMMDGIDDIEAMDVTGVEFETFGDQLLRNENDEILIQSIDEYEFIDEEDEEELVALIEEHEDDLGLGGEDDAQLDFEEEEELECHLVTDELLDALQSGNINVPVQINSTTVHEGVPLELEENEPDLQEDLDTVNDLSVQLIEECNRRFHEERIELPEPIFLNEKPNVTYSGQSAYVFDMESQVKPCSREHVQLVWCKEFSYYKDLILENKLTRHDYALRCIMLRDAFFGKYESILICRALRSILDRYGDLEKDTWDLEELMFRLVADFFGGLMLGFHVEAYMKFMEFIAEVNPTTLKIDMELLIQKCISRCLKMSNMQLLAFTIEFCKRAGFVLSEAIDVKSLMKFFIEQNNPHIVSQLFKLYRITSTVPNVYNQNVLESSVEYSIDFETFDMIIKYLIDTGHADEALWFFESYYDYFEENITSVYEQWVLVAYQAHLGLWKEATTKFDNFIETGQFPNSKLAHQVLLAYQRGSRHTKLLKIYDEMRENQVIFEEKSHSLIYDAYIAKNDDEGLANHFSQRKQSPHNPVTIQTVNALLKIKNRLSKHQEVIDIFKSELQYDQIIKTFEQKNDQSSTVSSSELDAFLQPNEDSITELIVAAGCLNRRDLILEAWKIGHALDLRPTPCQCLHTIYFSESIPVSLYGFYKVLDSILPRAKFSKYELEIYDKIQFKITQFVNYETLSLLSLINTDGESDELNETQKMIFKKILRLVCLDLRFCFGFEQVESSNCLHPHEILSNMSSSVSNSSL